MDKELPQGIMPNPQKGTNREKIVRYASLYTLHMAEIYMQGCTTGKTDDLKGFLEWLDKRFWSAKKEIDKRTNFNVVFKPDDVYKLSAKQQTLRQAEMVVGLEGIAKFVQCNYRLFLDQYGRSNSLLKFTTEFLPRETKKIAYGKY